MSYSALQGPTDLFGVSSALRPRAFPLNGDHRRDSDSHSPIMSEPQSPLFRPTLTAEFPSHLASLYNSPYAAAAVAAAVAGQGSASVGAPSTFNPYGRPPSTAAFYPGMVTGDGWRRAPYLSQLDFCWPPGLRSLEAVVGPRTKAPREATTILKSWLNEHKDNPYPTKSEKMTLSLVTHMTLTQVSTWFANARRRIKKENKMTWTPKTRCGERDGSSSNEEESEKDYFGRQRSPFTMSRDAGADTTAKRTSGDYEERDRSMSFDGSSPSTSVPFAPNLARKGSSHPLFAAFSGLRSPYRGLNTSVIEDAFRQKMISKQDEKIDGKRNPGSSVAEHSRSPSYTSDAEKQDIGRRSPHEAFSPTPSTTNDSDKTASQLGESLSPFVHFKKSRLFGEKAGNDNDLTDEDKEKSVKDNTCIITKRDNDDILLPCPVTNKKDTVPKLRKRSADQDGSKTRSADDCSFIPQSEVLNLQRPFYLAGDLIAKSGSNGNNMDALSCWIRDFQHLVASGQEIKAKQALATALAVAAKAGAYSGMGGLQRPAPYYNPRRESLTERRLSSDGSINGDSHLENRRTPGSSTRAFRHSSTGEMQCETKPETDAKTSSPDMAQQRTPSPNSPPANTVRLRSPYKVPIAVSEDSPMNLSKPSVGNNVWKKAENGCIEA